MKATGVCAALAAMALTACSSPAEVGEDVGVKLANGVEAEGLRSLTGEYEFEYSWPREAAAVPALRELMRTLAEEDQAALNEAAREAKSDADEFGYPFRSYTRETKWAVAADTPRLLWLSASTYFYTGGAHGNTDFGAIVWDREAELALAPLALFNASEAIENALREPYCAGLLAAQEKRLGEGFVNEGDLFAGCPALSELTLSASSAEGAAIDGLILIAAPYVAGSFAEGPYEIALPVTPQILEAVKPEYRGAFAVPE
ncbi:DUF4163 domain-containing protein [Erythrobacter rubeus]|uniref:DUF4163 domain-containing protein n=1 Tax=Erythrobacter rubeus TaxID=2760803 RepID=A0ABR8KRG5_9SPHN|nr:DUF4163 domain-containing protein [Erythrobacter rubeus]MBD2842519.1 DUF4163 domain-containing protein [Erythrobacter rubeus]